MPSRCQYLSWKSLLELASVVLERLAWSIAAGLAAKERRTVQAWHRATWLDDVAAYSGMICEIAS